MRADQVGPAIDLALPQPGHDRLQARSGGRDIGELGLGGRSRPLIGRIGLRLPLVNQQAGTVDEAGARLPLADPFVGAHHPRAQPGHDVHARGDEPCCRRGQLSVPHLKAGEHRGRHASRAARGTSRLQQAGALREDLVVLRAHPGQRGAQSHRQVVHETTAHPGLLADQSQVLGGEDDSAQNAQQGARP